MTVAKQIPAHSSRFDDWCFNIEAFRYKPCKSRLYFQTGVGIYTSVVYHTGDPLPQHCGSYFLSNEHYRYNNKNVSTCK